MRRVVILDQFSGPAPTDLRDAPLLFATLVTVVERHPEHYPGAQKPTVTEVAEDFRPRMATTVYAADAAGLAFVWKRRWDTSG